MNAFGDDDRGVKARAASEAALEDEVRAWRNRMIGEWAATQMGLADVEGYARAVARPDAAPADEDVVRKVSHDLADSGLTSAAAEVASKMEEFLAQARAQLAQSRL
jgi:hypothetical protein